MNTKIFAVIDTNVLVSAMLSQDGYPYQIIEFIPHNNIIPLYDKRMIREYNEVFHYPKLRISEKASSEVLYMIIRHGIYVNDVNQTKMKFTDEDDIPFFEVKESSVEFGSYLVTGNIKHYPQDNYIVTPKELLSIMQHIERFIKFDINYEEEVNELVQKKCCELRYIKGDEAVNLFYRDKDNKTLNLDYLQNDSIQVKSQKVVRQTMKKPKL